MPVVSSTRHGPDSKAWDANLLRLPRPQPLPGVRLRLQLRLAVYRPRSIDAWQQPHAALPNHNQCGAPYIYTGLGSTAKEKGG